MSKARPIKEVLNDSGNRKALIYCRVSSERQKSEGHGLESQEQRCREHAKNRGYEVVKVFHDSFTGGGDYMRRPALSDLLKYISKNAHTDYVVIFDDLKRLARDTVSHWQLREHLNKLGAVVESPNFEFREDDDSAWMHEAISAVCHENERRTNRRQVIQKQKARLELGYWAFGRKRGFTMEKSSLHGRILTPLEPDASILREALEGFSVGRFLTKVDACRFLVEKGFWGNQKPERYIDKFTHILEDPLYAGYIEYPKWGVSRREGHHKGIISLDIFEANKRRLEKGNKGQGVRNDVSEHFPLRGLLVCADGGGKLTASFSKGRTKKYPYYHCPHKDCLCNRSSLPAGDVHDRFDNLLKSQNPKESTLTLAKEIFERVWEQEKKNLKIEDKRLTKQIEDLEKQVDKFAHNAVDARTDILRDVYEKKVEECTSEIDKIRGKIVNDEELDIPYRTALEKVTTLIKSPYKIWHSVDVREKQKLFHFIFLDKLPYSKKAGYRTDNLPSAVRLFEDFVASNSQDVEMAEIESASALVRHYESTVCRIP